MFVKLETSLEFEDGENEIHSASWYFSSSSQSPIKVTIKAVVYTTLSV